MFLMDVYSKHRGKEFYLVCFYSFGFDRKWKGLLGLFIIFWTTTTFEHEPGWFMIAVTTPVKHSRKLSSSMWDSTTNSDVPRRQNKYGDRTNMSLESLLFCTHDIWIYMLYNTWYMILYIRYTIHNTIIYHVLHKWIVPELSLHIERGSLIWVQARV